LRDELTTQTIRAHEGFVAMLDAPGLGLELNAEALEKFAVRA
jgi:L-alanine-DL-glutamate epimerase-like enolase superfamily enzyme